VGPRKGLPMVDHLLRLFPRLRAGSFRVTSPRDLKYNCIAWAAGDAQVWWWPIGDPRTTHWPTAAPRVLTLDAFREAFASLGYSVCGEPDPQSGCEKIAVFADARGTPTHAARQLTNGRWTSKLGYAEDIEHDLGDVEGDIYGSVVLLMKRAIK
jgi:hypothetical protein